MVAAAGWGKSPPFPLPLSLPASLFVRQIADWQKAFSLYHVERPCILVWRTGCRQNFTLLLPYTSKYESDGATVRVSQALLGMRWVQSQGKLESAVGTVKFGTVWPRQSTDRHLSLEFWIDFSLHLPRYEQPET